MLTAEFIFELPCPKPEDVQKIEKELCDLLTRNGYNIQSNVSYFVTVDKGK